MLYQLTQEGKNKQLQNAYKGYLNRVKVLFKGTKKEAQKKGA
jgi:hypothetical protein